MRTSHIIAIALVISMAPVWAALADDEMNMQRHQTVLKCFERIDQLQPVLESGGGGLPELQEYLYKAVQAIYTAKVQADWDLDNDLLTTNQDLSQLVVLGYLPKWPQNPLNEMQPMRILGPMDAPSPGDIVFSLCPSAFYTTIQKRPVPISFEVYIFGPEGTTEQFSSFQQYEENTQWSTPPQGALYGFSFYFESDRAQEARTKRMREKFGSDKAPPE